jgi:hypothetical protein
MSQAPDDPTLFMGQGTTYDEYTGQLLVAEAANIVFGTNPAFGVESFLELYPQFGQNSNGDWPIENGTVYQAVLQTYINLASACVNWLRWRDSWQVGMCFFVAHFMTLWLQSYTDPELPVRAVASAGLSKGIMASKSVGDVSVSYQLVTQGWESWGAWNLTLFGQQFIQLANLAGKGPVYVW